MFKFFSFYKSTLAVFVAFYFSIYSAKGSENDGDLSQSSSNALIPHQKRSENDSEIILISPSMAPSVQQTVTRLIKETGNFYYYQGFPDIALSHYMTAALGCNDTEAWWILGKAYEHGFPTRDSIFIPDNLLRILIRYRFIESNQANRYQCHEKKGVKFDQNSLMAIKIYGYLMKRSYEPAKNVLSNLCWNLGLKDYQNHNYTTAYNLFRLAVRVGNVHAAYKVGSMFENATITATYKGVVSYVHGLKKAKYYYKKAVQGGPPEAAQALNRIEEHLINYNKCQKQHIFDDFFEIDNNFFQNIDDHKPSNNAFLRRSPSHQRLTQWVNWSFEDKDNDQTPA